MQNLWLYTLAAALSLGFFGTSLRADTIISVQFEGTNGPVNFQGVEPDAAAADAAFANSNQWNHLQPTGATTFTNLITSTGANSGASLGIQYVYGYNAGTQTLPDTYFYEYVQNGSSQPFTISGLMPNEDFTLFLYAYNSQGSANNRGAIYTVGSSTFTTATGNPSSEDPTHAVDGLITGVTSSNGTISGTWAFDPANPTGEMDWSGFQIDVSSAVATPEPGTIVLSALGLGLLILGRLKKFAATICLFMSAAYGQPATGVSSLGTAGLDTVMQGLLSKYSIPGAALAVSRNGALVYARGFGYANTTTSTQVQPDSLFRVGSVSKTFTAIAIMELVEQGKIQLDQSAFSYLPNITPISGATINPQLSSVTVRELLNMTGGWDRSIVPDAVDNTLAIATATGLANPLSCSEVIQYQLGQPLQHSPGTTYAYSNFGYCILGEIVAQVSGLDYVDFVRQNVLTPLGIQRAKQADPFISDTVNNEVTYYDYPGAPLAKNVYNPTGPLVPQPYGNHDFLASEASGSWITTPIELLRFVNGIDGVRGGPLVQPATIQLMEAESSAFAGAAGFYGLGFDMHTATGGFNWFKDGALAGTAAYLYKGANKTDFAVVFNSAPAGALDDSSTDNFESDYVAQIEAAIAAVTTWPTTDQFTTYASTLVAPSFRATSPVENAESGLPRIVPGAWISIYGTNLATGTRTWYASEFNGNLLPYNIDSVSVLINGLPAPVYYVSPSQLDVQVPLAQVNTTPGTVVVTHDGQASSTVKVNLTSIDPALFTYSAGGLTFAAAVAVSTGAIVGDPSVEPGTAKVHPGDFVELYVNSMLPAKSGIINPPNTLQTFPTVTIGGVNAPVSYAGLVSPGLIQVNVQIPPTAVAGDQPVMVTYDGVTSPSGVVIPIGN